MKLLNVLANNRVGKEEVCTIDIRRMNVMKMRFTFKTVQKVADETALLDSSASENFLDERVWQDLEIGQVQLERPIPVHNVDRTKNRNGEIRHYCWL